MALSTISGAGRLKQRIDIYSNSPTVPPQYDSSGAIAGSPIPFALAVPAAIEPMSANDVIRSGQDVSQVQIPITIRYMDGIQSNMTVVWKPSAPGGRPMPTMTYIVKGIIHDLESFVFMTLVCEAIGNNF